MTREELFQQAKKIEPVSGETAAELNKKNDLLVSIINKNLEKRDDIEKYIGSGNIKLMKTNHDNHINFMTSVMTEYDPNVFSETVLWAVRTYMARGFKKEYWQIQMNEWLKIFRENLSKKAYREISPFYTFILDNLDDIIETNETDG
ncbi:hypothetical protein L21SP3_00346 [Sedimentisphaera cyanobacteriorum]|uniref:Uncharacterized protein n=1 Tax=Sedimentisphaera cyanobacteriorum TaxID=1940790 RepID=A0A1Q2HM82_9BACT|nr:hypothetical protein [Sedimentisphaera cyanobacteriorum]AQQ08562.1 hypothetical protein L21SP3_00346 [Sedimentisphaera cyanobacteriorum]